ncbi:MAG: hypothetical protein ACTHMB_18340 [Candidatus Binatia bacterium]
MFEVCEIYLGSSERMSGEGQKINDESRLPPALTIVALLCLMATLPGHVYFLPVWVSYLAALFVLVPMAAFVLTKGNSQWQRIERTTIILLASAYVANTITEMADMIGTITVHPSGGNAFSLLSSSVAIWIANVVMFSLLYWQIDGGGPRASNRSEPKTGLGFPTTRGARGPAGELAAIVPRLSISWIQHGDGI